MNPTASISLEFFEAEAITARFRIGPLARPDPDIPR